MIRCGLFAFTQSTILVDYILLKDAVGCEMDMSAEFILYDIWRPHYIDNQGVLFCSLSIVAVNWLRQ